MRYPALLLALVISPAFCSPPGLIFEKNQGQVRSDVQFLGRGQQYSVAFSGTGVRFGGSTGEQIALSFPGLAAQSHWESLDPLPSTSSYIIGSNSNSWIRNVKHSRRLIRRNIYDGIDVIFYGTADQVEFDFLLSPHADPNQIRLAWQGPDVAALSPTGDLELHLGTRILRLGTPKIFEELPTGRAPVPGRFVLNRSLNEAHFLIGRHHPNVALTIDPTIDVLTFLGGTGNDRITAALGNTVAGVTDSAGLANFGARASGTDIFIWDGSLYTLIGGSGDEEPTSITRAGNTIILGGWTSSHDFPLTGPQSFQRTFGGGNTDGFIIVNPGPGNNSSFSSYLGGSGDDRILAIAADLSSISNTNFGQTGYIVAGETTSPDFPVKLALQPALAGAKDGFLTRVSSDGIIAESTYWGGAGDDSILALDTTASTCWFAGRTNSPDLRTANPLQSKLNGATDGFLARLDSATVPSTLAFATYYGGSGDDEITALRIGPDSWIWTGGNTTSADLALTLPSQRALTGDADAWLARFDPIRFLPSFVTYFGGSGHHQLTSLAHDGNGDLYAAGFTNSSDLPLFDPFQSQPGGADDGFVARFDNTGQPRMSTYAGGAGNDRIRALTVDANGTVSAYGETDSPSIDAISALAPPANPKAINAGQNDGLLIRFHQDGIYAAPVVLGQNLTVDFPVLLLGANNQGLPITVRSADPSRVTVNGGAFSTASSFQLAALAGDSTVDLIVSVPGLQPRHVPIALRPSFLVNANPATVSVVVAKQAQLDFRFATTNPVTGEMIFQNVRPGFQIPAMFVSNNAGVLQSDGNYNSYSQTVSVSLRGVTVGTATVSIVSPSFPVRGPQQLNVVVVSSAIPVLKLSDLAVGQNLQTSLPLSLGNSLGTSDPFQITFTSEDPSRLLVSASAANSGAGVLSFQYASANFQTPVIWLQGRASSGIVRVRADIAGADPVYVNVALTPSVIAIATPAESQNAYFSGAHHNPETTKVTVSLGPVSTIFAVVAQIDGNAPPGFIVRDQLPSPEHSSFRIVSSNTAVSPVTGFVSFNFPRAYVQFNFLPTAEGNTTLSVISDTYKTTPPLEITVLPRTLPWSLTDLTLGKSLESEVRSDPAFDFPPNVSATITSSDPSRVLVSSNQLDEAASARVMAGNSFYVSALASSGDVPLTIQAPGYSSRTLVIHLAPLSFRLSPASLTTTVGDLARVSVSWYFPNFIPSYAQIFLRPNTSATFAVAIADGSILRSDSPNVTFRGVYGSPTITALKAGTTTVSLISISDAVVDPQFALSTVNVLPRTLALGPAALVLGKNLQRPIPGLSFSPNQGAISLRSLDPSRVLLSQDAGLPGSAAISNVTGTVYLQALADSGDVTILISAPNYKDASLTVRLVPTAIGFVDPNPGPTVTFGSIGDVLALRLAPVAIDPASGNPILVQDATLRPGLDPFEVLLTSSNEAVGRLRSPVAFIGGLNQNSTQFRADANGTTELSIIPPTGFADGGSPLRRTIVIAQSKLLISDISLGKNMQFFHHVSATGSAGSNSPPPATITSSDPSRLLVSNSPDTVGTASASIAAGGTFYVQALSDTGDVTISATSPGFDAGKATVHLEPSYFAFAPSSNGPIPSGTALFGTMFRTPVYITHLSSSNPNYESLRPGVGSVNLAVTSSNPAVLQATSPTVFPVGAGQVVAVFLANASGIATLTVDPPPDFAPAPDPIRNFDVKVNLRNFNLSSMTVGKDRSVLLNLNVYSQIGQPATVHFTSSDSALVTLSTDPLSAGSSDLSIDLKPGVSTPPVYISGLSASGSAVISATGPGFEPASAVVTLAQSGFMFNLISQISIAKGKTGTVRILTSDRNPIRGGIAPVNVALVNSNPLVAHPAPIVFPPGMYSVDFTITADTAGVTLLTISNNGGDANFSNLLVTVTP